MTAWDIARAADELACLLESQRKGLKHQRHARVLAPAKRTLRAIMRGYWARQEAAILREVIPTIPGILAQFVHEAQGLIPLRLANSILPESLSPLRFHVTSQEVEDYDDAMEDIILGAAKVLAKEAGVLQVLNKDFVSRWLRDNSLSKLTGNISAESTQRLRDAIAGAWDQGGSFDQIVQAIRDTFSDFSQVRAEMIAQTEANRGYNEGREAMAREMGFSEKAWETESGDPCQICLDNEAQGYIPMDDDFDSGDDAPPAHPNCACSLNFQMEKS